MIVDARDETPNPSRDKHKTRRFAAAACGGAGMIGGDTRNPERGWV